MSFFEVSELVVPLPQNDNNGKVQCSFPGCTTVMADVTNTIKRHYTRKHGKEFYGKRFLSSSPSSSPSGCLMRSPFATVDDYWNYTVKHSLDGQFPLSYWDMATTRESHSCYDEYFEITTNSTTVEAQIDVQYQAMMTGIRKDIANQLVSLQFDLAKKGSNCVALIAVHFLKDWRMQVHHIGIVPENQDSTQNELGKAVIDVLDEVGLKSDQIISQMSNSMSQNSLPDLPLFKVIDDDVDWKFKCYLKKWSSIIFGPEQELKPVKECLSITGRIKSAVNQYMTWHGWRLKTTGSLDSYIRWVTEDLKEERKPVPWSVKRMEMNMYKQLLEMRGVVNSQYADDAFWTRIEKLALIVEPFVELVDKLATQNYVAGDLHRDLFLCIEKVRLLDQLNTDRLADIKPLMLIDKLLQLPILSDANYLAGVFLDPRFRGDSKLHLKEKQKEQCEEHLRKVANRLGIPNTEFPEGGRPVGVKSEGSGFIIPTEMEAIQALKKPVTRNEARLESLLKKVPYNNNQTVLEYWRAAAKVDPEMGRIAQVVLGVPVNHFTMEKKHFPQKMQEDLKNPLVKKMILMQLNLCKENN